MDGSHPSSLTNLNGTLLFEATTTGTNRRLWRSDGTMPLTDIAPGILSANPRFMTVSGGRLFFTANDHANGWELWTFPLQ